MSGVQPKYRGTYKERNGRRAAVESSSVKPLYGQREAVARLAKRLLLHALCKAAGTDLHDSATVSLYTAAAAPMMRLIRPCCSCCCCCDGNTESDGDVDDYRRCGP